MKVGNVQNVGNLCHRKGIYKGIKRGKLIVMRLLQPKQSIRQGSGKGSNVQNVGSNFLLDQILHGTRNLLTIIINILASYATSKLPNKDNLITHNLSIHEGKRFGCDICGEDFSTKSNVITHIKMVHERVTYECKICEFKTTAPGYLREHEKIVHAGIRYKCPSCENDFITKWYLAKHIQNVHERNETHKCPKCNFTTHNNQSLKGHLANMHRENDNRPLKKCHLCNFSTKSRLESHLKKIHHDRSMIKCELCYYKTDQQGYFARHMRKKHRVIKPL